MKTTGNRCAGVALLEAMLSVSLVGIGLLTSLRSLGFAATTQSRLEDRAVARRLVEQQMAALCARGPETIQGEMGGRFPPPFESYGWSARSFEAGADVPFTVMQMRVWRGEGARRQCGYAIQTLVR